MTMLDKESQSALSIEAKAKDKCIAAAGREKQYCEVGRGGIE
jgi:hypothetical protein